MKKFIYIGPTKLEKSIEEEVGFYMGPVDDIYREHAMNRPKLKYIKQVVLQPNDTLAIPTLYSLGDSSKEIMKELTWMKEHRIHLRVRDIPITDRPWEENDFREEILMTTLQQAFTSIASHEKQVSDARHRKKMLEGGRRRGRPETEVDRKNLKKWHARYLAGELQAHEFADKIGVTKPTLYRILKIHGLPTKRYNTQNGSDNDLDQLEK
jgi:DNA invertase Pin-like site-specific DNA recombinase